MRFNSLSERAIKNLLFRFDDQLGFTHWSLHQDIDSWNTLLTDLSDILQDALEVAYDEGIEDGSINFTDVEVKHE